MVSIATSFAGIHLDSWAFNASGPKDTTLEELCAVAESRSPAVAMKTWSVPRREGNPSPRLYTNEGEEISQQAIGLANHGMDTSLEYAKYIAETYGKPVIGSIAAPSNDGSLLLNDWHLLMNEAQSCTHLTATTINLGCPSEGDPIAYDIVRSRAVLDATACGPRYKPIGIKVPQFVTSSQFDAIARLATDYEIDYLVTVNSIVRTLRIDLKTRRPVIRAHRGYAGLGGDPILEIAVGQVRMFYERLRGTRTHIVGVGGILPGNHGAIQHVLAGARAGKIGTGMLLYGPPGIGEVNDELVQDLEMMGFSSVEEAVGSMEPWPKLPG